MANAQVVQVLDGRTHALKGVLTHATGLGYVGELNGLGTAQFSLPATDPGNELIDAHDLIRFKDGRRGWMTMRAVEQPADEGGEPGTWVPYSLESAQATLFDDSFFGYQEIGGAGMDTAACIQWVLARQTVAHWVLYECDFDYEFSYVAQNNSLLPLLYSLSACFLEPHQWIFDTSVYPWRISLKRLAGSKECGIVYGRNLNRVTRSWSGRALINRMYAAGYGEGVNLLTIRGVNGGVPYVEDAESVARYGVKAGIYTNKAIQDAATLLAGAQTALALYAWPSYAYSVTCADLYEQTGLDFDRVDVGRVVWVYDKARGVDFAAQVVRVERPDVAADPYDTRVTISQAVPDIADSVASLASRVGIGELYSQGATQIFADRYADNADFTHPAIWDIYIPEDARTINSIRLKIKLENFRGYSKSAASGGGSTSGSGGGTTSGGGNIASSGYNFTGYGVYSSVASGTNTASVEGHVHGLPKHDHSVADAISNHTHSVSSHTHSTPNHTHDIEYGIYEGPVATQYTLYVDGSPIPAAEIVGGIVDIAPWMETDAEGRITRGADHTIELVPMTLTRVVMERFVRLYIQSVGGTVL